jgi:branched-chain amino acid transport system ATP-binding protein|tara:strand:+ start:1425 stop:2141 length:717 start_codon:yes stop_codon:yes gene_type:complete
MRVALEVKELEGGYDQVKILNGIDLHVYQGEFVTIIGPNGCGKSTFLKVIFGLAAHHYGSVFHEDEDVSGWRTDRLVDRGIAYVPQVDNVFPSLSVQENLQMGGIKLTKKRVANGIERSFEMFPDLKPRINDLAVSLSGGERQMLAIARALISEPTFLMLDEPTAALSPRYQQEILTNIDELRGQGISVLLVEQNARLSLAKSDRGYIFSGGRIIHSGNAKTILDDPDIGKYFLGIPR